MPSPSDGWHTCSRRCLLALDLTVRGTGHLYPPAALCGRLQRGWCCSFFVFDFVALLGTIYPVILRHFHLVVADRRATARTTDPLSHAATSQKKTLSFLDVFFVFVLGWGLFVFWACFCFLQSEDIRHFACHLFSYNLRTVDQSQDVLMTVRASSAHGMGYGLKKKGGPCNMCSTWGITDKSNVVRKQKHSSLKVRPINELIKQIHKQITSPRSSESRTRKLFRSQVIDGALEDTCKHFFLD